MTNVRKNSAKLTRKDLKIAPEFPTMERQELAVPGEFSVRNSMVISDETSDQTPAVEPSDETRKTVPHAPLVYRVEEIAQLLVISNRAAYNLCNTTKDFKVIRLGTSIRVSKQSFDDWFAAVWREGTSMASILRRGDSYSVRFKYKDHAGRICEGWESFKTKKEAQDRKISVEKELLDGTLLIPDAMTVAEMLYKWLPIQSSKHKWAPKTYTHTVVMIQNLVVPYLGKKQIQKVQTYDLEQFYATLSRTPRGLYKQGVKQTLTDKQKRQFLTGAPIREVHAMLKTAFSYAVEWGLLLKSPIPREAPKSTSEERAIWDEKTMLAALQTMTDPTLHLAVHLSTILSLRVGEILGLQPGDIDFDAADGRGTITVGRSLQRTEKLALEKTDPNQIYHIFPDQREGSSSALVLKKPKTKKSSRTLYLQDP